MVTWAPYLTNGGGRVPLGKAKAVGWLGFLDVHIRSNIFECVYLRHIFDFIITLIITTLENPVTIELIKTSYVYGGGTEDGPGSSGYPRCYMLHH